MKAFTNFNFKIYCSTPSKLLQLTLPLHAKAAMSANFTLGKFGKPKDDVLSAFKELPPIGISSHGVSLEFSLM